MGEVVDGSIGVRRFSRQSAQGHEGVKAEAIEAMNVAFAQEGAASDPTLTCHTSSWVRSGSTSSSEPPTTYMRISLRWSRAAEAPVQGILARGPQRRPRR